MEVAYSERVENGVREVLMDSLGVKRSDVTLDAKLASDLGLESLDYLDIVFRLEQKFKLKIPKGSLFPSLDDLHVDVDERGEFSTEGVNALKLCYGHLMNLDGLERTPTVHEFASRYTVATLVNYIQKRLEGD